MAVTTTHAFKSYDGNGVTTVFPVDFQFFSAAELVVTEISALGVETVKTISTHYTVSGGTDANSLPATGSVTMLVAPASGTKLRIDRATLLTQSRTHANNDAFPAKTVEGSYDWRALVEQDSRLMAVRAIKQSMTDYAAGGSVELALPARAAGQLLGWNAGGTALANYLPASLSPSSVVVSAFAQSLLAAADAADALALLGIEEVSVLTHGAVGDFTYASQTGTNDATAFNAAIAAVPAGGALRIPGKFYRLTSALALADKSMVFLGDGAVGTHLIFDDCDAMAAVLDHASQNGIRFKGISFVTTAKGTRTGVAYTGSASSTPQLIEAIFEDCAWFGADRPLGLAWGANPNSGMCAWLKGTDINTADRAHFRSCIWIGGQRSFTDSWPQATVGLDIDDCTQTILDGCETYHLETGAKGAGTTENLHVIGGAHVANRYGLIWATSTPNNQNVMAGVHFSNYELDVDIDSGGDASAFHSYSDLFFLRRSDATTTGFYHFKGHFSHSHLSDIQFAQVGLSLTPVASGDIAIRLYSGSSNNLLHDLLFYRQNTCVQIDSGCEQNQIYNCHTVDDGDTIAVPAYVDNGTDTIIRDNYGDRPSSTHQLGTSAAAVYSAGSYTWKVGVNRKEILKLTQGSATAVNYLDIVNSAAASPLILRAIGTDTDISIQVLSKGAGKAEFNGSVHARSTTAIPAGGTAGRGLLVSSTANFGVFFGSGVPTLAAAKGSLYLRSDGSTTNDRAHINTDGGTTWTAIITAG